MRSDKPSIDSLFLAVIERDAEERSAYLDEVCANDAALRARLERLIYAQAKAAGFLESPAPELATAAEQLISEKPGDWIGPYRLLDQIGEGGCGVVFLAEQYQPLKRRVALKIIKPGMDTRQVIARFEAERQALALMDHPNIARVFDAGTTRALPASSIQYPASSVQHIGRPYFVMELVQGIPITDYCDQCNLTTCERLELFITVCQAVQHAHQKGVIHRDIKPTNVLVTMQDSRPAPKIIDFGVAKAINQQLTEHTLTTAFAQMIGTPIYMSPEQAELSPLGADTRSDIYSLGVLLYELVTGTTPFDKDRLHAANYDELRRIIREEDPPRPSARFNTLDAKFATTIAEHRRTDARQLRQTVCGELDWIVMKCLEKDRNRRYETANGLAADVRRYLADEPVVACPPSAAHRIRKFVRRNKGPVLSAFLVLLALVGGIIGTTWNMMRATHAHAIAVNEARDKEAALLAAQQSERDAKDKLWLSLYERARAGRYSRQMGQRLESLAAVVEAARIRPDAALRDEVMAALALPDVKRTPGWQASPLVGAAVRFGHQYQIYARGSADGHISIRSVPDDHEIQHIVSSPILGNYLHFSADDRFLLSLEEGYALRVWRVADGQPALRDELLECRAHAFSPDCRHLAVGQHEWVLTFDLTTGQEVNRWRLPAPAHTMAFHPENDKLAVGYFTSSVASVYGAASGELLTDLDVGGMSNQVVAWHPDGDRLAVAGTDPRIQIWHLATQRKVATLEGHTQYVDVLTFHPGGELLASHGWDGQLLLWHPSSGRQLMRLISASAPQFSTDGKLLGVTWNGERVDRLEVTLAPEYRTLVSSIGAGMGDYGRGTISPDGRLLAVGVEEGARLWDLRSGQELAALPSGTAFVFFAGGSDSSASSKTKNQENSRAISPDRHSLSLLTSGTAGLLRWPLTSEDPVGQRVHLGPPEQLSPLRRASFARGPDGRTLVAATEEGGSNRILDLETGAVRLELDGHPRGEIQALSGDGRWATSCGWHSDRVRLWNAGTGQMVHEWVIGNQTNVYFTPDSRTLVIARGDEFSFWDVETLQPIRRLPRDVTQYPGCVAFAHDGRLMAMEMSPAVIHLKDALTGRTVAKLEDPHGDRATWQGFTPDGTKLVVVAKYAHAIHVWDLRAIRRRLKDMNLDWDWPEFSPAADGADGARDESLGSKQPASYTIDVVADESKNEN